MVNVFPDGVDEDALARSRPEVDMAAAWDVAEIFEHLFGDGRSVLDPEVTIWTAEAAEELRRRIEDNPILGTGSGQWDKLEHQLTGASRDVVLLAAELVFLREQPVFNASPATRREHLMRVLKMSEPLAKVPDWMSACLDRPTGQAGFKGGQGYNGRLWLHLIWAATFIREWCNLPEAERAVAKADPWRVQRIMLDAVEGDPDIRNAFLFLAFPDVFEPISSGNMKTQIRSALADRIGGPTGTDAPALDRDLLAIRASLAQELTEPFHYWLPSVRDMWDTTPQPKPPVDEPRPRHYWLYSPGPQASEWDAFHSEGIMAIGWQEIGDLAAYPTREAIRADLVAASGSTSSMKNDALCLWEFQNEIAVGDIVYAKRGRRELVGRGEVVSEARFEPERDEYRHVRSVKWTHDGNWDHSRHDAATKTLTDLTRYPDYTAWLESLFTDADESDVDVDVVIEPAPVYDRSTFLDEVYLAESAYDRLRALLLRKKNVILAGPPGVGKTYAARRLAYSIMGEKDRTRVQMVQFHQSYSYEDFMMGYRPTESGGFTLAEGPFYRFCEEARKDDADRPYFFIVDEINRGNISKIFGELLMLIEADKRGQELRLLYKNETFSVPSNVHIIGMMNTADRSLAVLDYALRRRFGFFEMTPGFRSTGFTTWQQGVESDALDALVDVVIDLNREIAEDPALGSGFAIGHSFFSVSDDDDADDDWLQSVVEDELVPLLAEYWFDEPAKADEWAGRLRGAIA